MTFPERLAWVLVSAKLGFEAQVGHGYLAPVHLAIWFAAMLAHDEKGGAPTWKHVVLAAVVGHLVIGLQSWSLLGHGHQVFAAHIEYLLGVGVLTSLCVHGLRGLPEPMLRVVGLALAWTVLGGAAGAIEGGYPLLLGATWVDVPAFAQLAALGGPWILDALIGMVGALGAEAILTAAELRPESVRTLPVRGALAGAVGVPLVVGMLGAARMAMSPAQAWRDDPHEQGVRPVWILQGAVPGWFQNVSVHWDRLSELSDGVYARLHDEVRASAEGTTHPLVVLPESAVVDILPPGEGAIDRVAEVLGRLIEGGDYVTTISVRAGTPEAPDPDWRRYRYLLLRADDRGGIDRVLETTKAVATPWADGTYRFDGPPTVLEAHGVLIGPLVCWDALFPTVGTARVLEGASLLVATSNDAGFRQFDGPGWHARMARLRAIETGVPLVYASQAGPSFVADGVGRVVASLGFEEQGTLAAWVRPSRVWTPYPQIGRWWLAGAAVALALLLVRALRSDAP